MLTRTTGLPVPAMTSISLRCGAGRSRSALSPEPPALLSCISSPSRFSFRPTTSTTTSLCSATVLRLCKAVAGLGKPLHAVAVQVAALGVQHARTVADVVLDALEHRDVAGCRAVVVADQRHAVVRVRADHADRPDFFEVQRQQAVVLEQHDAAARRLLAEREVLGTLDRFIRDRVVRAVFVELAEQEARREQPLRRGP